MGKPELFSYLSAFVTIVLAVGLSDMIQSTHRLIRARNRITWDARPLVFAAIVALAVISEFFSLWTNLNLASVSMGRLLWLLATPTVFTLLAYSALPDDFGDRDFSLADFWERERHAWVSLFSLALVLDLLRSINDVLSRGNSLGPFLAFAGPRLLPTFLALGMIFFGRGRAVSWLGLLMLSAGVLASVAGWHVEAAS